MTQENIGDSIHVVHPRDGGPGSAVSTQPETGLTLTTLAELPAGTLLDETALASALCVSTRTVRRMVDRCEIPAGVRLGARKVWFAERVLAYLQERADREAAEARKAAARFGDKF